ncbi:MAG: hypothetical protein ACK46Y_14420 [Fluviicola sp.]|jgi:hypothetical protein
MKKNSLKAFETKAIKIEAITGGYNWEDTYNTSGAVIDDEQITAYGEYNVAGDPNSGRCGHKNGCVDATYQCASVR